MLRSKFLLILLITPLSLRSEVTSFNNIYGTIPSFFPESIHKNCSQVLNESTVHGDVIMNCITNIDTLSKNERIAIHNISTKLVKIESNINNIKSNSNNASNKHWKSELRENKISITKLNKKYLDHKRSAININKSIRTIKDKLQGLDYFNKISRENTSSINQKIKKLKTENDHIKDSNLGIKDTLVNMGISVREVTTGLNQTKNDVINLQTSSDLTTKSLDGIKNRVNSNKKRINELHIDFKSSKEATKELTTSISFHRKQIYKTFSSIESFNQETVSLLNDLGLSINENTHSIILLEDRVDLIENDLGFLMNEYTDGNLKPISFFGSKIGTLSLNGDLYNFVGFEFERLLDPKYNMSWYLDVSRISGDKENSYTTLSGIDPEVLKESSSLYQVGFGARKFFKKFNNSNFYAGGSVGYTFGDEESLYSSMFLGVENYRKYNKISAEIGYHILTDTTSKNTHFNPLGESTVTTDKDSIGGFGLVLKYSAR